MENFRNAQVGIKKVFSAAIMQIISLVLVGVGTFLLFLETDKLSPTDAKLDMGPATGIIVIVATLMIFVALILMIIGFIFNLIGLAKAGKDDQNLKAAFIISVFGLVVAVIIAVLSQIPAIRDMDLVKTFIATATTFNSLLDILIVVFVCSGTSNLLMSRDENALAKKGNTASIIFCILVALSAIIHIIVSTTSISSVNLVAAVVLLVAYVILSLVAYIKYLVFLGKARYRLAD